MLNTSKQADEPIRRQWAGFIQQAGFLLELPNMTTCTAITFFHRFYAKIGFSQEDPKTTAQTCLFLASKCDENMRRIRDVLNVTYRLENQGEPPLEVSEEYWKMKDAVTRCEHQLMRVLGFDMDVKHPHHYLLHIVRELEGTEELAAVAYYVANDSLLTRLCLQYSPAVIACACIYFAGELLSDQCSKEGYASAEWWEKFGASRLEIEDVCHQLADLYEMLDSSAGLSTPGSAASGTESKSQSGRKRKLSDSGTLAAAGHDAEPPQFRLDTTPLVLPNSERSASSNNSAHSGSNSGTPQQQPSAAPMQPPSNAGVFAVPPSQPPSKR